MSKPLIYVVDDDPMITKVLEARFIQYECEVRTFQDPASVLEAIEQKTPALLVADLNLGEGLSGYDIIREVRNELELNFPIIVLSGEQGQQVVAHALEIGANDFLLKPPQKADFEETISKYVKGTSLPDPIETAFQKVNPTNALVKLRLKLSIEGVHPAGIILLSDHLIKKGAGLQLSGPEMQKIFPNCPRVFARVISSATKTIDDKKMFQIHCEVDGTNETALTDIKDFLASKSVEKIKQIQNR